LNLLSNAFTFTPPEGSIRIELRAAPAGDTARVEVADSGPGIAPDRRDEVFQRFHQLDGSSTRRMGGTGLGLHIARELVDLHHGSLGVDDAPEGGALFVVELPLRAPAGCAVHVGSVVPVDSVVDREVGEQLLAVLREALFNVIRHAAATSVEVEVAAGYEVVLRVCDDGLGASSEWGEGFGLRNMASRADALGGSFALGAHDPRGTVLQWRVPLGEPLPTI